jgi:hypothetical protein
VPRPALHHIALITAALAGLACASATAGSGVVPSGSAAAPTNSNRSVINGEELSNTHETNLYTAIQRLRPDWLRTRGPSSISAGRSGNQDPDGVNVYQDLQKLGSIEVLRSMSLAQATSLRFYTASEAQLRFGTGNPNGVIQIVTAP